MNTKQTKSKPRKCAKCGRVVFRLIPYQSCCLGTINRLQKVRDYKYIHEKSCYFCMDCIKVLFPDKANKEEDA